MLEQGYDRRKALGGSDMANILGCGFDTPFMVWAMYTGRLPRKDLSGMPQVRFGTRTESHTLDEYEEVHGVILDRDVELVHPKYSFLRGNADAIDWENGRVVEAKFVTARAEGKWGQPGTAEIPKYYTPQVMFYMTLARLPVADSCVRFGSDGRYAEYVTEFDKVFSDLMIERAVELWELIQTDTPPEMQSLEDHLTLWTPEPKRAYQYDPAANSNIPSAFKRLSELRAAKKDQEVEEAELKLAVLEELEGVDADYIADGRGRKLFYVQTSSAGKRFVKLNVPDDLPVTC